MKRTRLLAAALSAACFFAACGDDGETPPIAIETGTTEDVAATIVRTTTTVPLGAPTLLNPGFEEPEVVTGDYLLFATEKVIGGWRVVGEPGNVGVVGSYKRANVTFAPHGGRQWLDLTGASNRATSIEQTFATRRGGKYVLRFYVGNAVGSSFGTASTVSVMINDAPVLTAMNTDGAGADAMVWKEFTLTFTTKSRTTKIAFTNGDASDDSLNGLDDISLHVA